MSEFEPTNEVAALTVQLLSAYLSNNTVASEDIAGLIRSTKEALTGEPIAEPQAEPETFTPAVSVRKSVSSPEHILSLIDGRPYKTLKRHLMSHGLTPDAYRSRYNLPASYPMVAPAYADRRREVAQQLGLGRRKPAEAAAPIDADMSEPQSAPASSSETTQNGEPGKKTRAGRTGKAKRATTPDAPATVPLEPAGSADASAKAAGSVDSKSQSEPGSTSKQKGRAATRKRSTVPAQTKAAAGSGGRRKTKTADASQSVADTAGSSSGDASEGQAAPAGTKAKRRGKLGIFKKADSQGSATVSTNTTSKADTSATAQNTSNGGDAGSASTRRKRQPRMARGTGSAQDAQTVASSATDGTSSE